MDEPRYVVVAMLDDPKATKRYLRLPHRRLERRAGRQPDGQPDRADARRRAGQEPRAEHGRGAALRSRKSEGLSDVRLARSRGRRFRFRSDRLCDRPSQGRAGQRVRRVPRRACSTARTSSPRRSIAARSRSSRGRKPQVDGACPSRRPRAAARFRRARREIFRAVSRDGRRRHRHQRQDLDRRDDPPVVADGRASFRVDRDARRDHRPTTR